MGAIAELIKDAEEKTSSDISDALAKLEERARAPVGEKSLSALSAAGLPTAADESKRRLWKWVAGLGAGAVGLGALFRLIRSAGESARRKELMEDVDEAAARPSTQITIPMPKKSSVEKQAVWPYVAAAAAAPTALSAAGESLGSAWRKGKETVHKGYEHLFAPTGKAWDNPWMVPAAWITGILGMYGGYKLTSAVIDKMRKRRRKKELAQAEKDFQRALSSQFSEKPACIIGAAVDGVAQAYVDGELLKQAATLVPGKGEDEQTWTDWLRGKGGMATGGYLGLLAILASLGAAGGYHWIKRREEPRLKYEAAKELLLRRQMAAPPTVTVDTGD
jgi:hypothetical protein